jgi:DNA-binding GntR family transcriptional regulator
MSMTGQKKSDSLRAQVYQELRGALRKGRIGSSRIATERELAEQLGVSRTPVREALALLVHEGLISSTSRGFAPPELSREDLADLYQIRRLLEPNALATVIDRLSTHDFRTLRQLLSEQEAADARGNVAAFVEANSNFRAVWLGAVPNKQLRALIERHNDHVRWVRQVTLEDPKVRKKALAGLRKILVALQEGKPAKVSAAMLAHLDATEQALAAVLENTRRKRTAA